MAEVTGRRRWVRRQVLPLGMVGDVVAMDAAARRLHKELRAELEGAGMVPEPRQGSVTLYMNVVELPHMVDGVPQTAGLDEQGHALPLRREPYPTGDCGGVPAWAGAVELLLEAYVVPAAVPTGRIFEFVASPTQHPDAASPCWAPTGTVEPGAAEYYCQRGVGHPELHEVVLKDGIRMRWGPESARPPGEDGGS